MNQPDGGDLRLSLAFAPLHKRAFGIAVGSAVGSALFAATLAYWMRGPTGEAGMWLLGQYFAGYSISLGGAFIGLAWGFATGFVAGWFVAFCRNFAIAVSVFVIRTKAELAETREFLDHI